MTINTQIARFILLSFSLLGFATEAPSVAAIPAVADVPLGDLFATPGQGGSQQATTPAQPQTPSEPVATTPPAPEFFLEAPTGTRYKTAEDAINGVAEKDNTITQLRQEFIKANGYDPLTGQMYQRPAAAPQATAPVNDGSYQSNIDKYYDDLQTAVQNNDRTAYAVAQRKLAREEAKAELQATLAPYQSFLNGSIKQQAIAAVSQTVPDFGKFYGTAEYANVLAGDPTLAHAIKVAESDVTYAPQLPGLLSLAYTRHENSQLKKQLSDALKGVAIPAAQTSQAQPTRPGVGPSTLTPPLPNTTNTADFRTNDAARKVLLEQGAAKFKDMPLSILSNG